MDAQLPPMLADWLSAEYGVEAHSLRDLGLSGKTFPDALESLESGQAIVEVG